MLCSNSVHLFGGGDARGIFFLFHLFLRAASLKIVRLEEPIVHRLQSS